VCEIRLEPDEPSIRPIPTTGLALHTRQYFGLPVDMPIVATGHQPVMPHPGILIKYLRARSLADAWGGRCVNLVIDTGVERVGDIDVPLGHPPADMSVATLSMLTEYDGVLASRPPGVPNSPHPPEGLMESAAPGIETMTRAWQSAAGSTAAEQAAAAVGTVLRPYVGEPDLVFASSLLRSPIGQALLEAMRSDGEGCVRIYNEAVAAYPNAGVRPLSMGAITELPLWCVEGRHRRPASTRNLDTHPTQVLPRALVTTALTRAALADHFVHGLGGVSYDRIMERWMDRWLGWSLCPRSLATATVRLPGCSDQDIERALQHQHLIARRLIHDPQGGGRMALSSEKAAMLGQIQSASTDNTARHEAFVAMHRRLADARTEGGLRHARSQLAAATRSAKIASRRTWAFPLYPSLPHFQPGGLPSVRHGVPVRHFDDGSSGPGGANPVALRVEPQDRWQPVDT
jgi:hypothetical protein